MSPNEKKTLGEYIQEVRKERGVSIDEIVRETNMSKHYLEAIEADNFGVFPGETYAMGFIANYADVLEISRDTAVGMYKRQMKIEQDSPIEQLVGKKKEPVQVQQPIIIVGAVVGLLLLLLIITQVARTASSGNGRVSEMYQPVNYFYNFNEIDKVANTRFRVSDTISISNGNRLTYIQLSSVKPGNVLVLKINNNDFSVKAGDHISLDSYGNGTNDMGIDVYSIRQKEVKLSLSGLRSTLSNSEGSTSDELYTKNKEYILSETELLTAATRSTVNARIVANATVWISTTSDGKDAQETTLNSGSTANFTFDSNAVLMLGNAGAVKIVINNREESGGGAGEVNKSIFYWKNRDGQFVLVRAMLK
jgi:transcriptional regulator with XRE-family HTH domain